MPDCSGCWSLPSPLCTRLLLLLLLCHVDFRCTRSHIVVEDYLFRRVQPPRRRAPARSEPGLEDCQNRMTLWWGARHLEWKEYERTLLFWNVPYRTNAPSVLIFSSFSTCFHYPAPVIVGDKNNKKVLPQGHCREQWYFAHIFPFHISWIQIYFENIRTFERFNRQK